MCLLCSLSVQELCQTAKLLMLRSTRIAIRAAAEGHEELPGQYLIAPRFTIVFTEFAAGLTTDSALARVGVLRVELRNLIATRTSAGSSIGVSKPLPTVTAKGTTSIWIVVSGNVSEGFDAWGTFPDPDDARWWAQTNLAGQSFHVVAVVEPGTEAANAE